MSGRLRLIGWKPVVKNTLRGFADVELPIGLVIKDVPVHLSHGSAWAALPARPQIDKDGQPRRDQRGKLAYSPVLEWNSATLREAFSRRVVEIVQHDHPEALG